LVVIKDSTDSQAKISMANTASGRLRNTSERGTSPIKTLKGNTDSLSGSQVKLHQNTSVPSGLGAELVEIVRRSTDLSFEKSQHTVQILLGHIQLKVPCVGDVLETILKDFSQQKASFPSCVLCVCSPNLFDTI